MSRSSFNAPIESAHRLEHTAQFAARLAAAGYLSTAPTPLKGHNLQVSADRAAWQRRSPWTRLCKNRVRNRLSAGGRWTRTFGTAAEKPGISETSRKRPGRRGPIWLTPPSPSSAGARPRRHLAVPARQICEAGIHCQPDDRPEPERDHRRDVGDRVALACDKAAPGDEAVDHAYLRQCRLARDLGNLRHLLHAGLEDLAGVLEIAADMSEQN